MMNTTTLIVSNFPINITHEDIQKIFGDFKGYLGSRLLFNQKNEPEIVEVEFNSYESAEYAKKSMQNILFPNTLQRMFIEFKQDQYPNQYANDFVYNGPSQYQQLGLPYNQQNHTNFVQIDPQYNQYQQPSYQTGIAGQYNQQQYQQTAQQPQIQIKSQTQQPQMQQQQLNGYVPNTPNTSQVNPILPMSYQPMNQQNYLNFQTNPQQPAIQGSQNVQMNTPQQVYNNNNPAPNNPTNILLGAIQQYKIMQNSNAGIYFPPNQNSKSSNELQVFKIIPDATNSLYVDGVPVNSKEREVAHIFRPFPGYIGVRLIKKRTQNGREFYFCFVDFENQLQASIALTTLQGYRFDKNDAHGLKISFANEPHQNKKIENNNNQKQRYK